MHARHLTVGIGMVLMLAGALLTMTPPFTASAFPPDKEPKATLLVTGLEGGSGSTIGPDGALYVTEGVAGRIARVDPQTGTITTFASGLPTEDRRRRRGDGRRVPRQDRVCPGHPCRP